jgi:type IV secretory pathway TrbL component
MNLDSILSEIDLEISRLQQAKQLLSENSTAPVVKRGPGRPAASVVKQVKAVASKPKRHSMSAAGRARIAAAQKARWAKTKKAAKKAAASLPAKKTTAKPGRKKVGKPAEKKAISAKSATTASAA